jgi:NADH dehydrogenase
MARKRVVIVGGGFAGIEAAKALRHAHADVTLIDRSNHFVFQPLLYQVATGALAPSDIAVPIRWALRSVRNTTVLNDNVEGIDKELRRVRLGGGSDVEYDYLILAAGSRHAYFGHDDWEPFAPGLKTIEDALEVRNRFLAAFEAAEQIGASRSTYAPCFCSSAASPAANSFSNCGPEKVQRSEPLGASALAIPRGHRTQG